MTDTFTSEERSRIMRRVRSKNTTPEIRVRSIAHALGYRFRLHAKNLPGTPDIIFPSRKKAIFVNGCFWHGHFCKRLNLPTSNAAYWKNKIQKNSRRDRSNKTNLKKIGWKVITIWECQIKNAKIIEEKLISFLGK